MEKPAALRRGEKWIVVLTLVFALLMTGLYLHSTRLSEGNEYTVRVGELAQEAEPVESEPWQVNINTATAEELTKLPGVGEVLAQRIVDYRTEHGPFRRAEELMQVSGIGEGKFAEMRELIILEEEAKR